MDVKYQIFVSSTFKDLEEERRAAIESILNLGHIPVGMELFQAGDETQWNYIKRRIMECDYYLVIVAERYGSEVKGKSYTQMEYEYALKNKKPAAAFLLHPEVRAGWSQDRVEFEKKAKVDSFRDLCQKKLVKHWRNADDLAAKMATTLVELMREKPQVGWVRADSMPSASVLTEIARLSEEKRELQRRVEELNASERVIIPPDMRWRLASLRAKKVADYLKVPQLRTLNISLLDLLLGFRNVLAQGCHAATFEQGINNTYQIQGNRANNGTSSLLQELAANAVLDVRHSQPPVQHGLVTAFQSTGIYILTEYGKQLIMYAEIERDEMRTKYMEMEREEMRLQET